VNFEIIKKSGSWFAYGEERVQGRDGLRKILQESPELQQTLENEVRARLTSNNAK
jgi:recombination protein RecA